MDRSSKETMCARKGKPARSKEEETASLRVAKELQRSLNGLRGSTRTSKKAKVVEKAVKRPAKSQKGKSGSQDRLFRVSLVSDCIGRKCEY